MVDESFSQFFSLNEDVFRNNLFFVYHIFTFTDVCDVMSFVVAKIPRSITIKLVACTAMCTRDDASRCGLWVRALKECA
jgi:hypothetical protein